MKRKLLLSPLIIIVLIVLAGVGMAGAAILIGTTRQGETNSQSVDLQRGLVGWWDFNGNAKDKTMYANNGTVSGAVLANDRKGQAQKAYGFDGTDDLINVSGITSGGLFGNAHTISAWAKLAGWTTNQAVFGTNITPAGTGDYITIEFSGAGTDKWNARTKLASSGVNENSVASANTYTNDTNWHHLALVVNADGTIANFYVDGTDQGSVSTYTYDLSTMTTAYIGQLPYTSANVNPFNGSIDDVRIYNRALSATEITALYESYSPGVVISDLQKGLVGQWKMNGDAKDSTPNANNGTVTGAVLANDRKGEAQKAYGFNGSSTSIISSTSLGVSGNQISVSAWFKANTAGDTSAGTGGTIFDKFASGFNPGAFTMFTAGGGTLNGGGYTGGCTYPTNRFDIAGTSNVVGNGWHHGTMVYDGSRIKLYVDGVSEADIAATTTGNICNTSNGWSMGATRRDSLISWFDGQLDDVRIYNRALSATEVTDLYQEYNPGIQVSDLSKGLVGQWSFDGATKDVTPYSNNATAVAVASATGGTISYSGGYTIHTFTTSGTFTPNGAGNVEYLVVGGGGGGGQDGGRGGGGGGGGFRTGNLSVTAQAYTVTVGAGGLAGVFNSQNSTVGGDSTFSTITATGGGRGGGRAGSVGASETGGNGGSGGGGAALDNGTPYAGGSGNTPSTSPSQGSNGGAAASNGYDAGGGGGASQAGQAGQSGSAGGYGGAGTASSISGASITYAGGGGGGSTHTKGAGGAGGGGDGQGAGAATAGTDGLGGGGGGNAAAGGSGVVIIRYPSVGTFATDRKGQINKALAFNGQSDSSSASAVLNWTSTTPFSYGGWFKLNDTTTGYMLASSNGVAVGALITSLTKDIDSGKVTFIVGKQGTGQTNATSSTAYTTGAWEHYLAVYDGANNMTLYRNGASVATGSYSNGSATSTGSGLYMMYASNNTNYVNGSIDDVRVYNRALTAAEVLALYENY